MKQHTTENGVTVTLNGRHLIAYDQDCVNDGSEIKDCTIQNSWYMSEKQAEAAYQKYIKHG